MTRGRTYTVGRGGEGRDGGREGRDGGEGGMEREVGEG